MPEFLRDDSIAGSFGPSYGGFIFQAISAVSVLIVSVGILYVLVKLGSFLDAMKGKT
jgi:hypothetical protein